MIEISFIVNGYSFGKSGTGRLIQVIAETEIKWQSDALLKGGPSELCSYRI